MRMILDAVDKRAVQDQVSFGLTLVVHMGLQILAWKSINSCMGTIPPGANTGTPSNPLLH